MSSRHGGDDGTDTRTDGEDDRGEGDSPRTPLLDRRSYLAHTAAAVGASAVGGSATSDPAAASHVTDLEPPATESDVPSDEPIDRSAMTERRLSISDGEDLSSYVANSSSGELLVVPEGTYEWHNQVTHSYTDWGIRGEWGGDVRIAVQDGWGISTSDHWLVNVDNGDNVLVENLRIDTETHDGRATPGFRFYVPNTGLIHHVIWLHKGPKSDSVDVKSRTLPYAQNASGHVMLDGLVINNRGNLNYNNTGDRLAWSACDGKLTFRNCKASGFGDNVIYTRMSGEMVVENCVFANTTPTCVRLGGDNETIRDCTFWVDTNRSDAELYNLDGGSVNTSPIMADNANNASNGGYVENCTFVVNSTPHASGVFRYLNNEWIDVSDSQVMMDDPGVPGTNLGDSESITWTNVPFNTTNSSGATVAPNPDATYNTTSVCVDDGLDPGAITPDSRGCSFDSSKHHPFPSDGDLTLPEQYGDSSVAVSTDGATNVDGSSATLNGTLDSLGGADSADCYFEWRESGASSWNTTSAQTLSSTGSFSDDLTGLSEGTEYEFRAVADASDGDSDTGGTLSFVASNAAVIYQDDAVAVHASHYDTSDRAGVEFTVSNGSGQELTVTHVTVTPADASINELHDESDSIGRWVSEVHVDADVQTGVCDVSGSTALPRTFDMANDGWSDDADRVAVMSAGSTASVAFSRFEADGTPVDMAGETVDVAVDYQLGDGSTGTDSFTLDVEAPVETHRFTFDDAWRTQSLDGSYSNPVVAAEPVSHNGGQPAHTRLRSVSGGSFDARVEEWEYLDGSHIDETVSSLTVEQGAGSTDDGTPLEAGTVTTTDSLNWASVSFSQSFSTAPVVITAVQTYNGGQAVVTRNRNVSTGGCDAAMQEEEDLGAHIEETIGYVAVEPGTGTLGGAAYEAGTVSGVDDTWTTIGFSQSYTDPAFLADMQTINGDDPCGLRYRNLGSDSVEVFVEEEGSYDDETTHANPETVGFVVVENS